MPPPPEIQAMLDRQRAARDQFVESCGPAGPEYTGQARISPYHPDSRPRRERAPERLDWITVGNDGTATAGDGRYLIEPTESDQAVPGRTLREPFNKGFVAKVFQDSAVILESAVYPASPAR